MANNQIVYSIKVNGDASSGKRALSQIGSALDQAGNRAQDLFNQLQQLGKANNVSANVPIKDAQGNQIGSVNAAIKGGQQAANTVTNVNTAANQANTQVQKLTKNASSLGSQFKAAWDQALFGLDRVFNGLRMISQGVMELGFVLSTFVTGPLMLLFKAGFSGAVEFEAAMARVRKAVDGMSPEAFTELEKRIRNLSKITPTTAAELAGIAEEIGQLGVVGNGVYRMLNLVNKAIIGTGVAAEGFATDLGRVAAALGLDLNTEEGMQQLESLVSVMDYVAKKTSTDMDGIMAAVKDAAVIGGILKETLKPEELIAGLGVLITSGVDPTAAGTVMQRFFVQVMKNADQYAAFMSGFERKIKDANGNIIDSFEPYQDANDVIQAINDDPIQVLTDTVVALNTATDEDKAKAIKNFMDAVGFVGGRLGAMGANADDLEEILAGVNAEMKHAITLQMDYERMLQNTDSALKIFKNNMNDLGITIGNYVMPYINQAIEYAIPIIQDLGKAFEGLDGDVKLLIVAVPLVLAVLGPLLFLLGTLSHSMYLTATGFITIAKGIGVYAFKIGGFVSKLGLVNKAAVPLKRGLATFAGQTLAAGQAAGAASGWFVALLGTLGKFLGGIVGIPLAILGVLKVLQKFGLDVSTYFTGMADQAKAWGERLMVTYGSGLMAGAVRVISKVVTTVANWIARFFEAHSPPEEGPLSTIDQWGSALMNTYLKGFLEADFGILSEVGSRIERAFEIFASLNNLDLGSLNDKFMQFREDISQVIKVFNETGAVAEDVLGKVGDNLGTLGTDIQELVRLWLKYKVLQEKLAALERKKKDTLRNYDSEIAKISRMNITAEEKAELIRQAMLNRDDELRQIEQEKKETEEAAEAAKDKVDWQKEYIDAQLEFLELLKKKDKSSSGSGGVDEMEIVDFSAIEDPLRGVGSTVQDLGEEFNSWSEKIDRARGALQQFKNAFQGKKFGEGMSTKDLENWQQEDPEGYKRAQDLYALGLKAKDVWESVSTPVRNVIGVFDSMKASTDELQDKLDGFKNSLFIQVVQELFDAMWANVDIFTPLTNAIDALDKALNQLGEALGISDLNWKKVLGTLGMVVGLILTVVIGTIMLIVTTLINVFATVVEYVAKLIATLVTAGANFAGSIRMMWGGLWDFVVGIFTGNTQKITEGWGKFLSGLLGAGAAGFQMIIGTVVRLLEFLVVAVVRILRDLFAFLVQIFKGEEAANQFRTWVNGQVAQIQSMFDRFMGAFNGFKDKVKGWYDTLKGWLTDLFNIRLNFAGNVSASGSGTITGHATGGITVRGKPHLAWVGEGKEQEAIIPLSKLPGLMAQMYGSQEVSASGGIVLNINNPVVREDQDIDRIADAVARRLGRKTNNSSRMGSGVR